MWGPVVVDSEDEFYCECTVGTNNAGELCGMLNALLWARRQGGHEPFAICFDSMYARNVTSGVWKPKKNKGIAALCYRAFCDENARRTGGVSFIHVKAHSDNTGNDKADERVQWGKVDGPYCRFRPDGSCEGEYIDSPRPKDDSVLPTQLVHPSPSRRMRDAVPPLQPFASNVRQREGDTPSSARLTALGMHGNFTRGSCCVVGTDCYRLCLVPPRPRLHQCYSCAPVLQCYNWLSNWPSNWRQQQ